MGYGLNGSVWGRNGAEARKVAGRLHAGTVNVNEASAADQRLQGFTPPRGIGHEQWARIMARAFKTLRALGVR
ncbi:aldehyde dehydrogenase family protein [Streptomyces sp. NPDC005549]|uniref:aldehyde dehydrogenase family protein n=1 Tax=Streptomyces sp. NPDC005549 TaxID=3154888 RepID=UPI0033AE7431